MHLRNDMRQKNTQKNLDFNSTPTGEARAAGGEVTESFSARHAPENPASTNQLMEEVCERENLKRALQRVKANKGSPGIDGMTVEELPGYLQQHWPAIREQLLSRTEAECASSAFRLRWTDLFSKQCCRFCNDSGTRRSPNTATVFDRDARPIKRWHRRRRILPKVTAGWSTSTWKNFSIESITTN